MSVMPMASKILVGLSLLTLLATPTLAGVVYEATTTYSNDQARGPESTQMLVEGRSLKMEIQSRGGAEKDEVIFRGDRRQVLVVDHRGRSYMVFDQETLGQVAGQMQGAMSEMQGALGQMEEALKHLPEDQRRLAEQALKGKMPTQAPRPQAPKEEFRKTSERETHQGYPTVRWDVFRGGEKVKEYWVTDWRRLKGGGEVRDAFEDMEAYFQEMMDAFGEMAGGFGGGPVSFDKGPITGFTEIGGFPVVTRDFEGGELDGETILESVTERDLDPDAFEPPKGYRLRTMGPG